MAYHDITKINLDVKESRGQMKLCLEDFEFLAEIPLVFVRVEIVHILSHQTHNPKCEY